MAASHCEQCLCALSFLVLIVLSDGGILLPILPRTRGREGLLVVCFGSPSQCIWESGLSRRQPVLDKSSATPLRLTLRLHVLV